MELKPNTFISLPRVFVYYHWLKNFDRFTPIEAQ